MNEDLLRILQEHSDLDHEPEDARKDRMTVSYGPFVMAGSKTSIIPDIVPLIPRADKFIDVFCGSAVVSLNVPQPKVLHVINDRHSGISNFFRVLREKGGRDRLLEFFENAIVSRDDFIICKETWKSEKDDYERACKWLLMIKLSVLGKSVSFARQTNSKMVNQITKMDIILRQIHRWLQRVIVENLDFRTMFRDFDSPDTVFYCDPPYLGTDVSTYDVRWTETDQRDLLTCIRNAQGKVALSGYPLRMNDEALDWDERHEFHIKNTGNITGKRTGRLLDNLTEVLWVKK